MLWLQMSFGFSSFDSSLRRWRSLRSRNYVSAARSWGSPVEYIEHTLLQHMNMPYVSAGNQLKETTEQEYRSGQIQGFSLPLGTWRLLITDASRGRIFHSTRTLGGFKAFKVSLLFSLTCGLLTSARYQMFNYIKRFQQAYKSVIDMWSSFSTGAEKRLRP